MGISHGGEKALVLFYTPQQGMNWRSMEDSVPVPCYSAVRSLPVSWFDIMRGSGINTHASLQLSSAALLYNASLRPHCQQFSVCIRGKSISLEKVQYYIILVIF